jgi:pimeloyl-ACP methyl ester carboxylesterase
MAAGETSSKREQGFERTEYNVNGVRTVVYSAGSGRPLVYWHGAGTFSGIRFAREWTRHFRVICSYHPGWGESADSPAIGSMNDLLLHYLDLFEVMKLSRFDLVGISLGGWMAAEFAVAHGHLLRKLVLVAPAGLNVPEHPYPNLSAVQPGDLYSYLVHDLNSIRDFLPEGGADAAELGARVLREMAATRRVAPMGPINPRLEHWLHRVTTPTLLIWPRLDRLIPVGQNAKWMQCLPDARLEIIENAGHLVLNESARARQAVVEFLS